MNLGTRGVQEALIGKILDSLPPIPPPPGAPPDAEPPPGDEDDGWNGRDWGLTARVQTAGFEERQKLLRLT